MRRDSKGPRRVVLLEAVVLLGMLLAPAAVVAFPRFQQEIPNIVPGWPGVGHLNPEGGGARNQFGKDFEAAGFIWTPELCRKDSDGDGKTNGQELGAPDCTWRKGQPRPAAAVITHPGVSD